MVFPELRSALFPAGGAVAGGLGVHPFTRQPGRTEELEEPWEEVGKFAFVNIGVVALRPSRLLFHSQDPAWSKPTFLSWRTSFAGPSSSTESSITRVSVAKLWGTPVFKVSRVLVRHRPGSRDEPAWERPVCIAHISGITAPQSWDLSRIRRGCF